MSSIYSVWKQKKRHAQHVVTGAILGALVVGVAGFFIGHFVVPIFHYENEALRDPDACGMLFCWMGLIAGLVIGARIGEKVYRKLRRGEYYAARRERFADAYAAHEAEEKAGAVSDGYDEEDRLPRVRNRKDNSSFQSPWP